MREPTHHTWSILNKWTLLLISVLLLGLFVFVFYQRDKINEADKHLPIDMCIVNNLSTAKRVTIKLNDSTKTLVLDSIKKVYFHTYYQLGINRIQISVNGSQPIISDTFQIKLKDPGVFQIEIDKPDDNLKRPWNKDSIDMKRYYFYKSIVKSNSFVRVKFGLFGIMID